MPVKIEFSTANAEFADDGHAAIAHTLRLLADHIEVGPYVDDNPHHPVVVRPTGVIRDANGNRIGKWLATIDAEQEGNDQ